MELALKVLSGLCWTCVYAAAIRAGFRDRTYALPAFALGLNLVWEALYFAGGAIYWNDYSGDIHVQTVVNGLWLALDIGIVVTYVRFGPRQWPMLTRPGFWAMSALILVVSGGVQAAILAQFGPESGARYSAFAQNLLMSVLFIAMLYNRRSTEGQSRFIAVNKMVGTLAPTIASGFIGEYRPFVAIAGVLCLGTDVVYLIYFEGVRNPVGWAGEMVRRLVQPISAAAVATTDPMTADRT